MKRLVYFLLPLFTLTSSVVCVFSGRTETTQNDPSTPVPAETSTPEPTATTSLVILDTPTPTPEIDKTKVAAALALVMQESKQAEATPTQEPASTLNSEMIFIPAGPFILGSDNGKPEEGPAQTFDLSAFEIDKYEVTNAAFTLFVEATGYETEAEQAGQTSWRNYAAGKADHPVVKVTWHEAQAFCEWAGKRLPTEMEWEKAARGEDGRVYPWGNTFDASLANVKATGLRRIVPVGSFPQGASPYGVEDMAGNVWEWTASRIQPYLGNAVDNTAYNEDFRINRGGAWFEEAPQVTTFNRNFTEPDGANDDVGFRCVRDP